MSAHELHEKATRLANSYLSMEKELIEVLQSIDKKRIFVALGYPSLFVYCTKALSLSEAQAYAFISVSRKCTEVPLLQKAIAENAVTVSKARRIVSVIDKGNAPEWLDRATTLTAKELEREVVATKPEEKFRSQIRPVSPTHSKLTVALSSETETLVLTVQDLLCQKRQRHCDLETVVREMALHFLKSEDPLRKTSRPRVEEPRTVTQSLRRAVLQRDEGSCQAVLPTGEKCGQSRWLHLHHVEKKSQGGKNNAVNLITLCSGHHRFIHSASLS